MKKYEICDKLESSDLPGSLPSRLYTLIDTEIHGWMGETIWDNGDYAIAVTFEPGTDGREAGKYLLLEPRHRKNVTWYDDIDQYKKAWHQINECACKGNRLICPAIIESEYPGPLCYTGLTRSVCYIDVMEDDIFRRLGLPFYCKLWRTYESLENNPDQIPLMIELITISGNYDVHGKRNNNRIRRVEREKWLLSLLTKTSRE